MKLRIPHSLRLLAAGILFASAAAAETPPSGSSAVTLDQLIARTLENDIVLGALRGEAAVARAARRNAAPLRNPQLRVGYSEGSDTTDLAPLVDPLYVPDPLDNDLNDRSEQYSVQVRFYPRNPFELVARERHATLLMKNAEAAVERGTFTRALDITANYVNLLAARHARDARMEAVALSAEEAVIARELFDAGQASADEYHEQRMRMLDDQADLSDAETAYFLLHEEVAAGAMLQPDEEVADVLPAELLEPLADRIDETALLDAMTENSPELNELRALKAASAAEEAAATARGIPWVNLVAATYQREERYDVKYQDEFTIVAGIDIPLFDWFTDREELAARVAARSYAEQAGRRERLLESRVRISLEGLRGSEERLAAFRAEEEDMRRNLEQRLSELASEDDVLTRQRKIAYRRVLLDLDEKAFEIKRDHILRVLEIERLVGVPLETCMTARKP